MERSLVLSLALASLLISSVSAMDYWNSLNPFKTQKPNPNDKGLALQATRLKAYCESWRINVELHNVRDFVVVPQECVSHIKKFMTSSRCEDGVERAVDEVILYLANTCGNKKECDSRDAWIFDIDDTLLSTVLYFKKTGFG